MSRTEPAGTPLGDAFHVYDTTLRDGAQREGISYSVADKLAVARHLDALGVGFIEGGWPGAMPKDTEFFARAAAGELELRHAALVAFGATRKAGATAADGPAGAGPAGQRGAGGHAGGQVRPPAHRAGAAHRRGRELRDGRRHRGVPARRGPAGVPRRRALLRRLPLRPGHRAAGAGGRASTAGADVAVLCDTNGGMLPLGIAEVVTEVAARTGFRLGIHCQDDTGCAVANSVAAVQAGATHVQCTANGYGERAGNADLFAVVGNLVTKLGMPVLPDGALAELTRTSHALAEIANIAPDTHQAYVGTSAFAHKAGLHASAIKVDPELYNHIDPVVVGNGQRVLVTEMAGRASVELKGCRARPGPGRPPRRRVARRRDGQGPRGAGLVVRGRRRLAGAAHALGAWATREVLPFALESYRVITEHRADGARRRGGHRQGARRRASG